MQGKCRHIWREKVKIFVLYFLSLFGLVWGILSGVENFVQCVDFYPVRRLLSSGRLLSRVENFLQYVDFYPVRRLLSTA